MSLAWKSNKETKACSALPMFNFLTGSLYRCGHVTRKKLFQIIFFCSTSSTEKTFGHFHILETSKTRRLANFFIHDRKCKI